MEEEIEDALQDIYKNLKLDVKYIDIRKYLIIIRIKADYFEYEGSFEFLYNAKLTFNANIGTIENEIDKKIIEFYKKGVVKK